MTYKYDVNYFQNKSENNSIRDCIQTKTIKIKRIFLCCFFCGILCLEWLLSIFLNNQDISNIALVTYILYILAIFYANPKFVFEYFWILISASLNILGVWTCETQKIYLVEMDEVASPAGSLLVIISCYFLFISIIECSSSTRRENVSRINNYQQNKLAASVLNTGIILLTILFLQVIQTPYFLVGLERIPYLQKYTTPWEQSLKAHMLMFIPIAGICGRNGHLKKMCCFMCLLLLYYFWVGDKFGAYLLALYLFVISYFVDIDAQKLRTLTFSCAIVVVLLLGIIFLQKIILFDSTIKEFWDYLYHRLAQQGEVWWSVFRYEVGGDWHLDEFADEIMALFPFRDVPKEHSGQWKMMLVSSNYSTYSYYRVNVQNPYTSTTTASVFYYFKWVGLSVFYVFAALLYKKIIQMFVEALYYNRVLETMILVKLISFSHSLLTASDGYLFTYKGILYIAVLIFLVYLRKRKIKVKLKYENRCIDII